ncbi:hypothetical protein [Candidatus Magnetominusculus dajiuhuensis]
MENARGLLKAAAIEDNIYLGKNRFVKRSARPTLPLSKLLTKP